MNAMLRTKCLILMLLVVLRCPLAYAQPSVALSAEVLQQFRYVLFTFNQADPSSMNDCHYNLFAADQKSDLSSLPGKGRSIATFSNNQSNIQIIAGPLPRLNLHNKKSVKIYFRTLLSCPASQNGLGEIISIAIKTYSTGSIKSVDQLTRKMKYSMQYYTSSVLNH